MLALAFVVITMVGSQPARAVWIEILSVLCDGNPGMGHSLRGLCGLKSQTGVDAAGLLESQPARAVWIEIALTYNS